MKKEKGENGPWDAENHHHQRPTPLACNASSSYHMSFSRHPCLKALYTHWYIAIRERLLWVGPAQTLEDPIAQPRDALTNENTYLHIKIVRICIMVAVWPCPQQRPREIIQGRPKPRSPYSCVTLGWILDVVWQPGPQQTLRHHNTCITDFGSTRRHVLRCATLFSR